MDFPDSSQIGLFEQVKAENQQDEKPPTAEIETADKPKPGAEWNGKIWVSDDDVGF